MAGHLEQHLQLCRASTLSSTTSTRRRGGGTGAAARLRRPVPPPVLPQGQPDRELAALSRPALRTETVPPCRSTSRFTRASPMPSPPCDAVQPLRLLDEEVEHAGEELGRDAVAGVADAEHRLAPSRAVSTGWSRPRRVLKRVVEEVVDDLLQPRDVGVDV